jgi:hypothetical protein
MALSTNQIKWVAALTGMGALCGIMYQQSVIAKLQQQNTQLQADADNRGVNLLQACQWDINDARVLNPGIPQLKIEYDATRNECVIPLSNSQQVEWPPGAMPINDRKELVISDNLHHAPW